jgi:hypothetical protein
MWMSKELIVGCYTPGDYAKEAEERLLKSVRELGLPHDVREIPSRGSWVLNNSACQIFLQAMDKELPDVDFLYIDVDGMVRSDPWPLLRTLDCDVAAHYINHGPPYAVIAQHFVMNNEELLSGTLYLPAGPDRARLLERWVYLNSLDTDAWDQRNLQYILHTDPSFDSERLPPEYCAIFDIHRRRHPGIQPVIEHFQASRRLKSRVK